MKKTMLVVTACSLLLACGLSFAASDDKNTFPPVDFSSQNSNDPVVIANGSGVPLLIVITLPGSGQSFPGVNILNCGNTTHLSAGSTAICSNNDSNNPVTLTAESDNKPVKGTYQIKQLTR